MTFSAELNRAHVQKLFRECIIMPPNAIVYEGDVQNIQFRPQQVKAYRREIKAMLEQLHPSIYDGVEWLSYMFATNGAIWGNAREVTQLIALGMAASYIVRLTDAVLRYEGDIHPPYHCPVYRTHLAEQPLPTK